MYTHKNIYIYIYIYLQEASEAGAGAVGEVGEVALAVERGSSFVAGHGQGH